MTGSSGFKDYFSADAPAYAAARPSYPDTVFAWLARIAPGRDRAWDCATGNGQAAVSLARHFAGVVATDASAAQIANARRHPRISYRVARAEAPGLPAASFALVTVAQAAHWLDLPRFYAAARRIVRPGGIVALWGYALFRIEPALDAAVRAWYAGALGPYWPAERRLIDDHYRTLEFPFAEIAAPALCMQHAWTLEELLAYLRTWSAVTRFRRALGSDPVRAIEPALAGLWGGAGRRPVRWPLFVRAGHVG